MNEVINNIMARRSIRKFKADQVPNDLLKTVLEAGTYAPLGSFGEKAPYRITAINNKEKVEWVNEITNKALLNISVNDSTNSRLLKPIERAKQGNAQYLLNAPVFIFITNEVYENAMADCSCIIQNIMLAAASVGLGTCWINIFSRLNDCPEIKAMLKELDVPPKHNAYGCIALGYPDMEIPEPAERAEGLCRIVE